MRALLYLLVFTISVKSFSNVEFYPRSRRYLYDREDLILKLSPSMNVPSKKEYEQMRDLLDDNLRGKFPTYDQYIKNLLNEYVSKNILTHSLDLLAENHKLTNHDISNKSLKAFNLINLFLDIDYSLPFDERIIAIENSIGFGKSKIFRLTGFSFGELTLNLSIKKKTLDSFIKINSLEEKVIFDSSSVDIIEKIFKLKNAYEIKSFLEYLMQRESLFLSSESPDFIEFLTNRVLQFSYDLLMDQIDAAVMIQVKRENRKKIINEFIKKTAGKNPFLSLFIDQSHLDIIASYLKNLPESPLLKPNLRASGVKVSCESNCKKLIEGYEKGGDDFLKTLNGRSSFFFDKYPVTPLSEKLSTIFFNPLNDLLGVNVAETFNNEVYFLTSVKTLDSYELSSSSKEYRDLVNREYSIQRLNNLLFLSLEDIFYQMNFTQMIPLCIDGICSDVLEAEDIKRLLFHQLNIQDDFRILRGKDFLVEIF